MLERLPQPILKLIPVVIVVIVVLIGHELTGGLPPMVKLGVLILLAIGALWGTSRLFRLAQTRGSGPR